MISSSDILNAKILVVDDRQTNVLLLDAMLSGAGYACIASTMNPCEVCELHRKNRYDLILLDLRMPGMDGFEVMEGLKQIEIDGYLPVVVITAEPDDMLRALNAGARDFISKPINLAEVLTRVHNMLEVRLLHNETQNNSKALEQTVERLQEVERLKNGFLSTASHELRTPLTSIRGSLGLLTSGVVGPLSDEAVEVVAIAERNAVRLMALINDILDLERLETGAIKLRFAQVSVESILRRAMESLPTVVHQHGVTVRGARGLCHDLGRRRSDRPGCRQSLVERREVLAARCLSPSDRPGRSRFSARPESPMSMRPPSLEMSEPAPLPARPSCSRARKCQGPSTAPMPPVRPPAR